MCHPSLKDSLMAHNNCGDDAIINNAKEILNKLTLFQIPDVIILETPKLLDAQEATQKLNESKHPTRQNINLEQEEEQEENEDVLEGTSSSRKIINRSKGKFT